MHAAADDLPEDLYPKIKSIVMFGDPMVKFGSRGDFPDGLQDKVLQNCADGDPVSLIPPLLAPPARAVGGDRGLLGGSKEDTA